MEPRAPVQPAQPRERLAARGSWAEGHHGPPAPLRRQLLRAGQAPRPGSWHGRHLPAYPWDEGPRPRDEGPRPRDEGPRPRRPASRAEHYDSSYPSQPYSRQGYENPHRQFPAAGYGNGYPYQSHQWQPVIWQDDRDLRQGETYGKNYRDQHYYRGYHPNLATGPPGQDRTQTYNSREESYTSTARREGTGEGTLGSGLGEAGGYPKEPSGQPSLLLQYHESGLSSSSHELSQYIRDGADHYDPVLTGPWDVGQAGGPLVSTSAPEVPLKFPQLHTALCFGAGGHLVLACPHHPAEGWLPRVKLHSVEAILHGTEELEELQAFPGPLAREDLHKVDVMTFCQQKITTGCDLSTQRGRDSSLLWKLLVLLCQQNGSMVGSDAAELLMQDCRRHEQYKRQEPAASLVGLTDDEWAPRQPGTLDLITGEVPPVVETQAQIVDKFTKLLYYGRKKEALVWAMRNQLWGHALFLSSKMDARTYSWVLTGFTSTLATNDPLQTLFQLMSGRIPQAALCCGDATWGDWRPHLAVILSNKVGDTELNHRAIVTMGDTLASKGAVEAAHFCYLMADIPFGYFGAKAARMALLGSSHRQAFSQFARTEAIQRMEIFEYCQQLRQPESFLLPFQVYKLLYASRLADHGLPAQALQYCEHISTLLLRQDPAAHPVLARQVVRLAERLKLSDPLLLEMPEQDQALEPDWLQQLRARCCQCQVEDDLPLEVAPTQQELPCAVLPTADEEPGNEIPQSEDYQYDQWFEPVPSQGHGSLRSPAPVQIVALPLPSTGRDLQPPVLGQGTPAPLGGDFAEPSLQPELLAGEAGEPWGPKLSSGGVQPAVPTEQEELPTRSRTVSETSTVSLGDSRRSLDSADEDAAGERAEAMKPEEDKSSGFRWFGWFRSKPTKETSPKAESETDSDSPTSGSQERTSPSPSITPLAAGINPLAQPLSRNPALGGMQGENTFAVSPVSVDVKSSWEKEGRQSAGQQTGYPGPLPPLASIPLFNPAQVSQVAARPTQPRLLSRHRYPNPL
ncbi:protein transport protein Sec16B isoform X1 [Oenanthe melanoleuca]|uniref:protein transport protein Sec16B isoform X1 n=1 Tax=Oenanthe melanoleuca TaxID=2939378 RepID=UPI0024C16AA1|nr:protein transport protein Sec16B isoform X1 [Oenanthe melanoleuca]XP_056353702.1 protein transport protein Sec16B isoform X1 [Oenanthe melanoleuca]